MSRPEQSTNHSQHGATVLEFALVSAVFFFALLALFDFARYFSLQALLTKGAQNGLEVAKVIDGLRIDPVRPDADCDNSDPQCPETNYNRMLAARETVVQAATALPLATFASEPGSGGNFPLDTFQFTTDNPVGSTPTNINAVVLRPGEEVINNRTNQKVEHPLICPLGSTCVDERRARQPTESLTGLYRSAPILVQVQAEFRPLFPFWNRFPVIGSAVGYRELSTGSIDPQISPALACQNPPTCGANSFLTPACTCECNLTCSPIGNIPTVPNESCTACECDSSYQCGGGRTLNPVTCTCACQIPAGSPRNAQECENANGGVADSYWQFRDCNCFCPADLEQICFDRGKRYNRNTCSCVNCSYWNPDCAGQCPTRQLAKQCANENPPRDFDPEICDCTDPCPNSIICTHGTIRGCDNCDCPGCTWPKVRNNTGEEQCGACICPANYPVSQGCPDPNFPIPNLTTCKCEAPGGGPSS